MNEKEKWLAGEDLENENLSPDEEVIHEQNKTIESLKKNNEYMVKRCNYLEKENARLNYKYDMFRHGLVEISELSEKQLNDGTAWDIARYYIQEGNKEYNGVDTFSDIFSKKFARLQEQLHEANEVIKTTNRMSGNIDLSQLVYEDRRKIDGITMLTESYLEKYNTN